MSEIRFYHKDCCRAVITFKLMDKLYKNWGLEFDPTEPERYYCEHCRKEVSIEECYDLTMEILAVRFRDFQKIIKKRLRRQFKGFWLRVWKGNTKIRREDGFILCPAHRSQIHYKACELCKFYDGEGFEGESKCRYFHQPNLQLKEE